MFKNKHFIAAMIVTPILAILGYFAVDILVREKPHAAQKGASYELAAQSNCRYTSGRCELRNGEFKLLITPEWGDEGQLTINLSSAFPLQGAKIGFVRNGESDAHPLDMHVTAPDNQNWQLVMNKADVDYQHLQIAVMASDVYYYGEAPMVFTVYETTFDKDFRR